VTGHSKGRRCTVCDNEQVSDVNALLGSGSSVRSVARLYRLSRTTVGRHKRHLAPTSGPFALIRGDGGPDGPADPLAEAFILAERARTPRERIRALEQVRAATKLRLRGVSDLDADDHELLDGNVREAEAAFRDAPDFETAARALSGWRESILQRLDAVKVPEGIPMQFQVVFTDEEGNLSVVPDRNNRPRREPATFLMPLADYFRGTPRRLHDPEHFRVERTIHLEWNGPGHQDLKVYDVGSNAVVWAKDAPIPKRPSRDGEGRRDQEDKSAR
jgi:hypothetical protein